MTILLENIGKRFNYDWIFRRCNYEFKEGQSYAILGPNGSGKSTLLQLIAGSLLPSEGKVHYKWKSRNLPAETAFRQLAIATPYLELVEEFTLQESLQFHQEFKPLLSGYATQQVIEYLGLEKAAHKQIRYFSSGMKQRVKLAQAIFSAVPVVLLDEPCTNLDTAGVQLYQLMIREFCKERLLIVSSNDPQEYSLCQHYLHILDYRKA